MNTPSHVLIVVLTPLPEWNVEKGLSGSGTMLTSLEQTEGAEVRFLKSELIGAFQIELTNCSTAFRLCLEELVVIWIFH